jgi:hypothetical protein
MQTNLNNIKISTPDIEDIFAQGNTRYYDPEEIMILNKFIKREAIVITTHVIPKVKEATQLELSKIRKPQQHMKYLALKILKKEGATTTQFPFEQLHLRCRADIIAKNDGKTIAIECGPCRISKALQYLDNKNTELWIITNYLNNQSFHKIRRGPNWNAIKQKHDATTIKELKKIVNLLDI